MTSGPANSGLTTTPADKLVTSMGNIDKSLKSIRRRKTIATVCGIVAAVVAAAAGLFPDDAANFVKTARELAGKLVHPQPSLPPVSIDDVRHAACAALKPEAIQVGEVFQVNGGNYRVASYKKDSLGSAVIVQPVYPPESPALPPTAAGSVQVHMWKDCLEKRAQPGVR